MPPKKEKQPPTKQGGSRHKGVKLNQWKLSDMQACWDDFNAALACNGGDISKCNITQTALRPNIPVATFHKRVKLKVQALGYASGGARKPRVLSVGELQII